MADVAAAALAVAVGHGALVWPRSRNSVDAFAKNVTDRSTWSVCANITGQTCDNGQAAFWYVEVEFGAPTVALTGVL